MRGRKDRASSAVHRMACSGVLAVGGDHVFVAFADLRAIPGALRGERLGGRPPRRVERRRAWEPGLEGVRRGSGREDDPPVAAQQAACLTQGGFPVGKQLQRSRCDRVGALPFERGCCHIGDDERRLTVRDERAGRRFGLGDGKRREVDAGQTSAGLSRDQRPIPPRPQHRSTRWSPGSSRARQAHARAPRVSRARTAPRAVGRARRPDRATRPGIGWRKIFMNSSELPRSRPEGLAGRATGHHDSAPARGPAAPAATEPRR